MGDYRKALTPEEAKIVAAKNKERQSNIQLEARDRKQAREAGWRDSAQKRSLEDARKDAAAAGYASMSPGRKVVAAMMEPTARIIAFSQDLKKDLSPLPDPDKAKPEGKR